MSSDAEILAPGGRLAVTHALWYQVGVFLLAFLLMLALPARRGHSDAVTAAGPPPSESAADHPSPLRGESSP